MISKLRGALNQTFDTHILLDADAVTYEILVAPSVLRQIEQRMEAGESELELVIYQFLQIEMNRGIPVMIGFMHEVEREFFLRFISVSGVGPKAAVKAFSQPIPVIAQAIDEGDEKLLKSLPGIGAQRAREIIAKLQGKVGKYALIQRGSESTAPQPEPVSPTAGIEEEAIAVLMQLEYSASEAKVMVQQALEHHPKVKDSEELLNAVYRQRLVQAV